MRTTGDDRMSVTLRFPPALLQNLQGAAELSMRSTNNEAVYRLLQSFERDKKQSEGDAAAS